MRGRNGIVFVEKEFEKNRNKVRKNKDFAHLIETLTEVRDFFNELGYLTFGRDIFFYRRIGAISGNSILDSVTRTLESIRYCCMNANFADAYSLLRKYRDDLFYYVYLAAVTDKNDLTEYIEIEQLSEDEKNILNWVHNQQKNLYIGSVLRCIASHSSTKRAIQEFKLKESFDKLADQLNDYVHSNGPRFYNESFESLTEKKEEKNKCDNFCEETIFISVAFLFLIILINPVLVMSYDYMDYLDFGDIPPKEAQYWVAPFVSDFLNKYKDALDKKAIIYLRDKTGMQF